MRIGLLLALLASSAVSGVCAETLDATLNRLDRAGSQFKAMSANLNYVKHTAIIDSDSASTGTIKIKRPKPHDLRMLVDYTTPDRKTVSFEGQTVDIYLPAMKTVQEYDVGKNKDLLEQFFLVGFGTSRRDLEAAYTVTLGGPEALNGEATTRIVMVSKNPEVTKRLTKFELWISDKTGQPVRQKFYEPSGDYDMFTYSDMKINPNLSDSDLKLRLPKGVKKETPKT